MLALTWAGGEHAWISAHVLATLTIGVVVSVCFVLWQWKGTSVPLVPSEFTSFHACGLGAFVSDTPSLHNPMATRGGALLNMC